MLEEADIFISLLLSSLATVALSELFADSIQNSP